jgi:uncharacterized protein
MEQQTSENSTETGVSQHRMPSIDLLKGLGIIAGLYVSIWAWGGFSTNWQTHLFTFPHGWNYTAFVSISVLLEGKMRALIALVFGAGMLLFMAKYLATDKAKAADYFIRRQMWLIGLGLVNAILFLWPYDLLFHLGVMGILLFPFMRMQAKGLIITAIVFLLLFCGKNFWRYADDKKMYSEYSAVLAVEKKFKKDSADRFKKDSIAKVKDPSLAKVKGADSALIKANKNDTLTKKQAEEKAAWEGKVKGMKYDAKADDGEKKSVRETSYGKLYEYFLGSTQNREADWTYRTGVWELGMMMLLGMALFKLGFFQQQWSAKTYLLTAIVAIAIGLLAGWYRIHFQNLALADYEKYVKRWWISYMQFNPVERMSLALGYASLAMALLRHSFFAKCFKIFEAVGKLSLTNYLLQSIFLAWFFTGFGTGSYGKLPQWQLYFLVTEVVLVQIVLSIFWLRYFSMGPAEWLWRCAYHKKWLPFPKKETTADADNATPTFDSTL